jgi:hypothetical protein
MTKLLFIPFSVIGGIIAGTLSKRRSKPSGESSTRRRRPSPTTATSPGSS